MKLIEIKSEEDYKEWLAELNELCRIEDEHIVFLKGHYAISLDECNNPTQILEWVNQLCTKSWITIPILRRFILLASNRNKKPSDK
jgi:hypothetical protein